MTLTLKDREKASISSWLITTALSLTVGPWTTKFSLFYWIKYRKTLPFNYSSIKSLGCSASEIASIPTHFSIFCLRAAISSTLISFLKLPDGKHFENPPICQIQPFYIEHSDLLFPLKDWCRLVHRKVWASPQGFSFYWLWDQWEAHLIA